MTPVFAWILVLTGLFVGMGGLILLVAAAISSSWRMLRIGFVGVVVGAITFYCFALAFNGTDPVRTALEPSSIELLLWSLGIAFVLTALSASVIALRRMLAIRR